jgi:hypothetical protein
VMFVFCFFTFVSSVENRRGAHGGGGPGGTLSDGGLGGSGGNNPPQQCPCNIPAHVLANFGAREIFGNHVVWLPDLPNDVTHALFDNMVESKS